jgi:bifunctional NMN adenylyltransferase/nudix hydrolase
MVYNTFFTSCANHVLDKSNYGGILLPTMKNQELKASVGVVIGRFQVPEITEAHRDLVSTVKSRHSKVIILVGCAPVANYSNPLDFQTRFLMLTKEFPDAIILPIHDQKRDEAWSKGVDSAINGVLLPTQTVIIYGGRDSFIRHYSGKFTTQALESDTYYNVSGSAVRDAIRHQSFNSVDYRRGVINSHANRFPMCVSTVDVAVVNTKEQKVLMATKPGSAELMFIGGFTDPRNQSLEEDAARELAEETHLYVDGRELQYVGSRTIDDWRYRGTDKIRTTFFAVCSDTWPAPKADDDIETLQWIPFDKLFNAILPEDQAKSYGINSIKIASNHVCLVQLLQKFLTK